MKKVLSLLVALMLLFPVVSAMAAITDFSFLEEMSDQELVDLRGMIDDTLKERKKEAADDDEVVEATRANPAPIGSTVLYKEESYTGNEYTIQVVCVAKGAAAGAVLKSFDKYNARQIKKGQSWVLAMVHIEALASDADKVDLSSYYFRFVSKDGVEYDNAYISNNPAEVKAIYVDSEQYAWVAAIVKDGDEPLLTYKTYSADDTAWFSLSERKPFKGNEITATSLEKGAKGDDVLTLQRLMLERGYLTVVPNGEYDKDTVTAVKNFQKANGLKATGIADEETIKLVLSDDAVSAGAK